MWSAWLMKKLPFLLFILQCFLLPLLLSIYWRLVSPVSCQEEIGNWIASSLLRSSDNSDNFFSLLFLVDANLCHEMIFCRFNSIWNFLRMTKFNNFCFLCLKIFTVFIKHNFPSEKEQLMVGLFCHYWNYYWNDSQK